MTTIVAADLAAYSRLIAEDEEGVISRLHVVWSKVVSPLVRDAGGRVIKTMGDGFLAEFPSPIEAARCALAIQETMAAQEAERAERNQLRFRIGLHLGDVVAVGDDIFGDAVNVAARLEAISPVGGLCMSRAMRDQVKGRIDADLNSVGEVSVKNLPDPIEAWVVGDGVIQPGQETEVTPAVVVLPFDEIGAEDSFFADGIVDEITSALSSVSDILVIARQSAFIFKGRVAEIREVGRELGARYVVTGSIRRVGSRIRISVQLSSAKSGANLWSQRYDDDLDDLFELQDRVASQVAGAISPSIRASEIADARAVAPKDRKAYELYMSAFPHFWKHRREENERAIELLSLAIARDGDNIRAKALRAWAYAQQATYMWNETPLLSRKNAQADAEVAMLSVDDHAPSLVAIAAALGMTGLDHDRAGQLLERALSLDPNSAWGWMRLGWNNVYRKDIAAGLAAFDRAEALSPRDPFFFNFQFGRAYAMGLAENYDEAIRLVKLGLTAGPGVTWAYRDLASFCANAGRKIEADDAAASLMQSYPGLTIKRVVDSMPPATHARHQMFIDGLRQAGVPED
ncbi:adenylate/guanylate cyclase domain-containing protein [Sulfitobacter aestuariivivens]|uniref:adenylate/guanylate cyclase domain-containing protein n=1 Tax=Sulfitobacter aestuariivivens TaxID=2766981 RepID=UPI001C20F3A5|nr:adenylate/guanylate cyclase domain-containing protein [Sulfitobacter aestuariivivens]